ncbi:MAG: universal stress protein, partial [Desulfobacteraceae bacterium]|nr:universal stress protein [Desulfobacteraceae bacterium]
MAKTIKNILFASELSVEMGEVFEHTATMAAFYDANIVVLHVLETANNSSTKRVRMAFGEHLYEKLKTEQKDGAMNLLTGKNVDALKIRKALAGDR